MRRFACAICLWAGCLASAGGAGAGDALPGPSTRPAGGPGRPEVDGPTIRVGVPDADTPLILPSAQVMPGRTLPPPGTGPLVMDLLTGMEKDASGAWWTVRDEKGRILRLLPCWWLQTVEVLQDRQRSRWRFSGEVFHYDGQSYLLLSKAMLVGPAGPREPSATPPGTSPPAAAPAHPSPPVAPSAPETQPVATSISAPATPAAETPTGLPPSPPAAPTPRDIARALLAERTRPIVPLAQPATPPEPGPSVPPPAQPVRAEPGAMLADRLGRLVRPPGSDWYVLSFEADNTLKEPPVRLLPCAWLQRMQDELAQSEGFGVVFRVSGEIHRYRGGDYMLVRSAIRLRNMDQF